MSVSVQNRVDAVEAARFISEHAGLHVSPRTVLAWAQRGRIPHLKLGGRRAFSLLEIEVWLRAGHVGLGPATASEFGKMS